jgi:uncharacterized OsmC-like protein
MAVINGLDTDSLKNVVESIKQNWETGRITRSASVEWKGGFKSEATSRQFTAQIDMPCGLCGEDTAISPLEMVLQAYGGCLTVGYAMHCAARGIKLQELKINIEGEVDLPGFLGLQAPEHLHMDSLPGYKFIKVDVKMKAEADDKILQAIHQQVISTAPVGLTLSRAVRIDATFTANQG